MISVHLRPHRDIPIRSGHPWVYSGGVAKAVPEPAGKAAPGDLCEVFDDHGDFLGLGTFHPGNTIRVRMLAREKGTTIDAGFLAARFRELEQRKLSRLPGDTTGYRLVHGDADGLPGLVVDVYADHVVIQISTAGMDRFRAEIIAALVEVCAPSAIVERSDVTARSADGLKSIPAAVRYGEAADRVAFREMGVTVIADPLHGQKTGYYLDQRDARALVARYAADRHVIDLFSYSGAAAAHAFAAGAASAVCVDSSAPALELGETIMSGNSFAATFVQTDVLEYLSTTDRFPDRPRMLVCDPPAYAKRKSDLDQAKKAYIRLNRLCLSRLEAGDLFLTSSCSGSLSPADFHGLLRAAAGQARRQASILAEIGQPFDHTRSLSFPEGQYLKTMLLEVTEVLPAFTPNRR